MFGRILEANTQSLKRWVIWVIAFGISLRALAAVTGTVERQVTEVTEVTVSSQATGH